jgi:hypothetical protein
MSEFKTAVRVTGPSILILIVLCLLIYDQVFCSPLRKEVVALRDDISNMNSLISRIDERTCNFMGYYGNEKENKFNRNK